MVRLPTSINAPAFHPVYLRLLGAVLMRRGVTDTWPEPGDNEQALTLSLSRRMMRAALSATATPWLGLELGAAAAPHTHGLVGSATAASGTLDQALDTLVRFAPLRSPALAYARRELPQGSELVIAARLDLGSERGFVFDTMLVVIERLLQTLSLSSLATARYRLPRPAPAWAERYRDHLEGEVGFDREPTLRMLLPRELLARRCISADAAAFARAGRECAALLEARQQRRRTTERVRALLSGGDTFPSADAIATQLNLSPRTLFRQLAAEGSRLRDLVDALRSERAQFWLRETDLPIEHIAARLGYVDASNFSRCFRRWTGSTPRAFRRARPDR